MANKSDFTCDVSDYLKDLNHIAGDVIPDRASKGLFQGGGKMIRYAIEEEPKAPHEWGYLWKSQLVKLAKMTTDFIIVLVGFRAEYAAAQHEAPSGWHYKLKGAGPKYLESKLPKHMDEIYRFVADYIKKGAS